MYILVHLPFPFRIDFCFLNHTKSGSVRTVHACVCCRCEMSEGGGEEEQGRLISSVLAVVKFSEQFVDYSQCLNREH